MEEDTAGARVVAAWVAAAATVAGTAERAALCDARFAGRGFRGIHRIRGGCKWTLRTKRRTPEVWPGIRSLGSLGIRDGRRSASCTRPRSLGRSSHPRRACPRELPPPRSKRTQGRSGTFRNRHKCTLPCPCPCYTTCREEEAHEQGYVRWQITRGHCACCDRGSRIRSLASAGLSSHSRCATGCVDQEGIERGVRDLAAIRIRRARGRSQRVVVCLSTYDRECVHEGRHQEGAMQHGYRRQSSKRPSSSSRVVRFYILDRKTKHPNVQCTSTCYITHVGARQGSRPPRPRRPC